MNLKKIILLFFVNSFTYLHTETVRLIVMNNSKNSIKCYCTHLFDCTNLFECLGISDIYSSFKLIPSWEYKSIYSNRGHEYSISSEYPHIRKWYVHLFIKDGDIKIVKEFEFGPDIFEHTYVYDRNSDEVREWKEWQEFDISYHP